MDYSKIDARLLLSAGLVSAGLAGVAPASASLITYNVNLNFNPLVQEAPPGAGSVGTITGTVTVDQTGANTISVVGVDLTEATNDGVAAIGGGFGSPTYTSFTFTEYLPVTHIFFGSPISLPTSGATLSDPNLKLWFQTSASYLDGTLIGPWFQFVFPYPAGGPVIPGNFDSITSETKYLYGSVTVASGVPEFSTWALMLIGFAGLGGVGYRASRRNASGRIEAAL